MRKARIALGLLDARRDERVAALLGRVEQAVEMTLAQAAGGEHQILGLEPAQQAQQDARGERYDFEALARDRADALQRLARLARDEIEIFLGLDPRQGIGLDDVERIVRLLHVEPRQRAPRAAHGIEALFRRAGEERHAGKALVDRVLQAPLVVGQGLEP